MPAQHGNTQTIAKDYKTGLCLELTIQFHARIGLRYSAAQTTSKEPNCTAAVQGLHSHLSYIDVKLPGIVLVNNVLDKSFVWQHKYIDLITGLLDYWLFHAGQKLEGHKGLLSKPKSALKTAKGPEH